MNRVAILYTLAEFGPIVAFFVAGQLTSFNTAVTILMGTTLLACILAWRLERHFPLLPVLSALFVLIGGAITLVYNEPDAVIFADTVYYGALALTLAYSYWNKKFVFKRLFDRVFAISDTGWHVLTRNWLIVLTVAMIANELARYFFTPEWWIEYRFYKTILISVFACSQFVVSRKYRLIEESNKWGIRNNHTSIKSGAPPTA